MSISITTNDYSGKGGTNNGVATAAGEEVSGHATIRTDVSFVERYRVIEGAGHPFFFFGAEKMRLDHMHVNFSCLVHN